MGQPPRGGSNLRGTRTSSMQGCPLALALLDEGRGAVGCKHLHTLSRASLSGQKECGPALVVPYIQIHQRLGQCLQGFTVTIVGLEGCGQPMDTAQDTASFCSWGPWETPTSSSPTSPSGCSPLSRPQPACHIFSRRQSKGSSPCAPARGPGKDRQAGRKGWDSQLSAKG